MTDTRSASELPSPLFPTDVWLAILLDHGLSYFDLRRLRGVCKYFEGITSLPYFDGPRFRQLPWGEDQRNECTLKGFKLHPAIELSFCAIGRATEAFLCGIDLGSKKSVEIRTTSLPWINEQATAPAVTKLCICITQNVSDQVWIHKAKGVKVKDVLETVSCQWNSKMRYYESAEIWRRIWWTPYTRGSFATRGEGGWSGWTTAVERQDSGGNVWMLQALPCNVPKREEFSFEYREIKEAVRRGPHVRACPS